MSHPGEYLYAIASRFCSPVTRQRIVEPLIADMQAEYADEILRGRVWGAGWVRLVGYVAITQALLLQAGYRFISGIREWSDEDRRSLSRTVGFVLGAIVISTVVLEFWPLFDFAKKDPTHARLALYLIPNGLPITVPIGVTVGVFCCVSRRARSRLKAAALALACVGSLACFGTMRWILPSLNQEFRASVGASFGLERVEPGPNEISLGELRRQIDSEIRSGQAEGARRLAIIYHTRRALPFATFVLALFALSVSWRPNRRAVAVTIPCGACLAYFVLLSIGDTFGRDGKLPALVAMWMPNVLFVFLSVSLVALGPRSSHAAVA